MTSFSFLYKYEKMQIAVKTKTAISTKVYSLTSQNITKLEFIAREYPNNKKTFQRAMRNELSQLNAIAYDLGLNISDYKTHLRYLFNEVH